MWSCEEEADGLMIVEEEQDEREAKHANDLSNNANIVDDGYQSHSSNVNECADNNRDQGNEDAIGYSKNSCRYVGENGKEGDLNGICYCSHGENPSEEINPPGKPAESIAGQAFAPLVNGTRYREM